MEKLGRKNKIRYIRGMCGEYINGKIYMHSQDFNGILEFDLIKKEKRLFKGRNTAKDNAGGLSTTSVHYGDSIYFIHQSADSILKFSVKTKEKTEIFVAERGNEFSPDIVGEQMLLMPYFYADKIPCVDLKTEKISYIPFSVPNYMQKLISEHTDWHFMGDVILNDCIYRVCRFGPYINVFDSKTNISKFVKINGITEKFNDFAYDGKFFWFIFQKGSRIIKWRESENKILKTIDLQAYLPEPVNALAIKFVRGKLYVLLQNDARIIELDELNDSVHVYDPREIPDFKGGGVQVFAVNICKDERNTLYFLPANANGILALDYEGNMELLKTDVSTQDILKLYGGLQMNERMCTREDFVDVIVNHDKTMLSEKEIAGTRIWQCFAQEL